MTAEPAIPEELVRALRRGDVKAVEEAVGSGLDFRERHSVRDLSILEYSKDRRRELLDLVLGAMRKEDFSKHWTSIWSFDDRVSLAAFERHGVPFPGRSLALTREFLARGDFWVLGEEYRHDWVLYCAYLDRDDLEMAERVLEEVPPEWRGSFWSDVIVDRLRRGHSPLEEIERGGSYLGDGRSTKPLREAVAVGDFVAFEALAASGPSVNWQDVRTLMELDDPRWLRTLFDSGQPWQPLVLEEIRSVHERSWTDWGLEGDFAWAPDRSLLLDWLFEQRFPLGEAARKDRKQRAQWLLEHGLLDHLARNVFESRKSKRRLEWSNPEGETPLLWILEQQRWGSRREIGLILLLVDAGADLRAVDDRGISAARHLAAQGSSGLPLLGLFRRAWAADPPPAGGDIDAVQEFWRQTPSTEHTFLDLEQGVYVDLPTGHFASCDEVEQPEPQVLIRCQPESSAGLTLTIGAQRSFAAELRSVPHRVARGAWPTHRLGPIQIKEAPAFVPRGFFSGERRQIEIDVEVGVRRFTVRTVGPVELEPEARFLVEQVARSIVPREVKLRVPMSQRAPILVALVLGSVSMLGIWIASRKRRGAADASNSEL